MPSPIRRRVRAATCLLCANVEVAVAVTLTPWGRRKPFFLVGAAGVDLHCLDVTKDGHPRTLGT